MPTREWQIDKPSSHTIRLEHGHYSGRIVVWLDGVEIFRRGVTLWDTGAEHRFKLEGVRCLVRIIYMMLSYTYELWVDGQLQ
jgi:hypothetical protein